MPNTRSKALRVASQLPVGSSKRRKLLRVLAGKTAMGVGKTVETAGLRMHRYRDSIQITDLTNAGKRGKRVNRFSLSGLPPHSGQNDPDMESLVLTWLAKLDRETSYKRAFEYANMLKLQAKDKGLWGYDLYESELKGVHVAPAGFGPIEVTGQGVYIKADWASFVVRDRQDRYNEETCIPAGKGGKKDIKVFYRWVQDNKAKLKSMTFHEVVRGMMAEKIGFHQYCAMD